jgi:hypothetical protein
MAEVIYYVNKDVYICVEMFSHHERKNIFEIRCVATIFLAQYNSNFVILIIESNTKHLC